jgi:multidrug resistance efflux pump
MKTSSLLVLTFLSITSAIEYDGILFPSKQIILSNLNSGVVISLPFHEGSIVKSNSVLCIFDSKKDSLALLLSQRDKEKSSIQNANVLESDVQYELKRITYEQNFIRAPFNGTIVSISAKEYEFYSAGKQLIEIADFSHLITEISVDPKFIEKIRHNKIKIDVFKGNEVISGKYYSHTPVADPGFSHVRLKIIFTNAYHWVSGTSVKVRF